MIKEKLFISKHLTLRGGQPVAVRYFKKWMKREANPVANSNIAKKSTNYIKRFTWQNPKLAGL